MVTGKASTSAHQAKKKSKRDFSKVIWKYLLPNGEYYGEQRHTTGFHAQLYLAEQQ